MLNSFSSQLFARDRTRLGDVSDPAPHACQSLGVRRVTILTKLVADQLGHGLGVNLDVYTVPRSISAKKRFRLWKLRWSVPKAVNGQLEIIRRNSGG
jgi:hypothetical protein